MELDEIYPYADPLGARNLAVMGDGDQLQWHFDQTDFVVSVALQDAEEGGDFDVSPFVRSADDENYAGVKRVLDGDPSTVVTLPMTPGTLLVFAGRNSIHRVSPISGPTPRLVGLFGYDTKPGTNEQRSVERSAIRKVGGTMSSFKVGKDSRDSA
jgi:hypothetical protein